MGWRRRALDAEAAIARLYERAPDESDMQHQCRDEAVALGIPYDEASAEFAPRIEPHRFIYIVFQPSDTGPDLTFVDVENDAGESLQYGDWLMRDGYHVLRLKGGE